MEALMKNVMAASLRLKQYAKKVVKSKKDYDRKKDKPVGRSGDLSLLIRD
jgi:hypothetical protein